MTNRPIVLKFGGELIEDPTRLGTVVDAIAATVHAAARRPLVIVHGGGKEIDAALKAAGIEKRQVDGLRITDEATLEVVVGVLAGSVNTRLVAALAVAGVQAVGLTGADGRCGLSAAAPPHHAVNGTMVDLGRVGIPAAGANTRVVKTLLDGGFVPVIASIGVDAGGRLLNVNADAFAAHMAIELEAERLVVAGTTAGVLDSEGRTEPALDADGIERLVTARTATAGMIAKLRACEHAVASGVGDVLIVDGRSREALEAAAAGALPESATRIAQRLGARV